MTVDGPGDYEAEDLETGTASIDATGPASVTVWVSETLRLAVEGPASVRFYGSPEVTEAVSPLGLLRTWEPSDSSSALGQPAETIWL